MSKARLETFSDGVLAIVVTLLVLDFRQPSTGESISHVLSGQGYRLGAYVVAFLFVGVMWINHHGVFRYVERVDRATTLANLVLLMLIAVTPYTAALFASGLDHGGSDARAGAFVFTAVSFSIGVAFAALWFLITRPNVGLLQEHLDPARARAALARFGAGTVVYAVLLGLVFVSPLLVLVLHAVIALYYLFDQLPENAFARTVLTVEGLGLPGQKGGSSSSASS